jgi:hypothetical protein
VNLLSSTSLRSRLALAAFALVASGCSIPYSTDLLGAQVNSCASDSECPSGASCVSERCIGTNVDLSDLILEVRPNSGASYGASTSFLYPANKAFASLGAAAFDVVHDITLPRLGTISAGMVHLDYSSKCSTLLGPQVSVPATITFDHVSDLAGFRFDSYTVTTAKNEASGEYEFDASLVPGKYSVYIQPQAVAGCTEELPPPVFYPAQEISASSDGQVIVNDWAVIKPTTLEGEIQTPKNSDMTGWRLDIVEPAGGRVISTMQTLQQGMVALTVKVRLSFVWNDKTTSPYIRLRPPEGQTRPSVYWGLIESLSSQSQTSVHLSVANLQIDPRQVEIQVQDAHHVGVPSSVQVQSVKLSGAVEKNAAYAVDVAKTDENGLFKLQLPPGTYQFRARPLADASLAIGDLELVVPAFGPMESPDSCFCGHLIQVAKKAPVSGTVLTPMGSPLTGASITLSPSQPDAVSFWMRVVHAIDPRPLSPRSEIASSGELGAFGFNADPGLSDLTVLPGDQSGYPWLVRPRVSVKPGLGKQMGDLVLPNSAVLRGTVTDPNGALGANVVVNGWLPVQKADRSAPTTVIQIGSTTTDEKGRYTLILPASISE